MAGPVIPIEPPVRVDRQGGIESVATFRPNDRLANAEAIVFQSDGCTFPQVSEHLCYTSGTPTDKLFDGINIDDAIGEPIAVYAGIKCVEGPDADHALRAERTLDAGAGRRLEMVLEDWAVAGTALTAGANAADAIARVEQALDGNLVGQGVIMISRYNATVAAAAGALEVKDGVLRTKLGTPVIASGNVSEGQVYGLGAIVVEYQDVETREVLDPTTNTRYALAERIFAIAVDCEFRVQSAITA